MLKNLTDTQKKLGLVGLAIGGYFYFTRDDDAADGGPLPPGPGQFDSAPKPLTPGQSSRAAARRDFYAGTNPRRSDKALSGAVDWMPGNDVMDVMSVPHYAVRGCCNAWATAYPAPDGRTSRGRQWTPDGKPGRKCGCTKPGRDVGRSWWQPWKRANRKYANVPDVEFAEGDTDWSGGTESGKREVHGFVHEGVAWIITTFTRNFRAITDANPDVVYLVSTIGRAAYNARLGRQLEDHELQPRYKGKPVEPNMNPWAVHPWSKWTRSGYPGGRQPPLQADQAYGIDGYVVDFVGPVYAWAFLRKPTVVLPFRKGKKGKIVKNPKRSKA